MSTENNQLLYIAPAYPSPSQTFIAREVVELEKRGFEIDVVALNPGVGESLDPKAAERTYSLRDRRVAMALRALRQIVRSPLGSTRGFVAALRLVPGDLPTTLRVVRGLVAAFAIADLCRTRGIRHIHAHFGGAPANAALLAAEVTSRSRAPISFSLTVHGWHTFVDETINALDVKVARAAFVACISDFTRSQLMRIADPAHWPKLTVVRCGLDLEAFEADPERGSPVLPTVAMVARMSPEKGHMVMLDALAALKADGRTVALKALGGGPFEDAVRARADELGIADQVTYFGQVSVDVVRAEVAGADIFCLPSFAEGLPVSLMEAMALDVPVITTAISGTPELVVDGVTGDLVPAGRSDLIAERVARLLDDAEYRARVVEAGRAAVIEQHDVARNVGVLAAEFRRVGDRPGGVR